MPSVKLMAIPNKSAAVRADLVSIMGGLLRTDNGIGRIRTLVSTKTLSLRQDASFW
jgi:hypothetical protein